MIWGAEISEMIALKTEHFIYQLVIGVCDYLYGMKIRTNKIRV